MQVRLISASYQNSSCATDMPCCIPLVCLRQLEITVPSVLYRRKANGKENGEEGINPSERPASMQTLMIRIPGRCHRLKYDDT